MVALNMLMQLMQDYLHVRLRIEYCQVFGLHKVDPLLLTIFVRGQCFYNWHRCRLYFRT